MIKIICFSIMLICNIAILISSIIRDRTLDKIHKDILEETTFYRKGDKE